MEMQIPLTTSLHVQIALGLQLVKFTETLEDMFVDLAPNRITEYSYELANLFSTFYTECKVSLLSGMARGAGAHVLLPEDRPEHRLAVRERPAVECVRRLTVVESAGGWQ